MAKLINKTDSTGPYPGRTWKQEADATRAPNGGEALFPYCVQEQITRGECDNYACRKAISEKHHFCSKKCADIVEQECREEGEWEARVS